MASSIWVHRARPRNAAITTGRGWPAAAAAAMAAPLCSAAPPQRHHKCGSSRSADADNAFELRCCTRGGAAQGSSRCACRQRRRRLGLRVGLMVNNER